MNISQRGLDLIKSFEGLRLEAYQDSAGIWTIGYGHTKGAYQGQTCTEVQAERWLRSDVAVAERAVDELVTAALTQDRFDALVSFVFNVGRTAFADSTLLVELNRSRHAYIPRELTRWVHSGGKPLIGLTRRRVAESALYMSL